MLGSIIVSFVALALPIAAGISLAPKQQSDSDLWMFAARGRAYVRAWLIAVQTRLALRQMSADLQYSSTFHAAD
jgi:hypothetical protein